MSQFSFNSSASSATSNFEYNVNVTSEVTLIGKYQQLNDTLRQANLIVNVFNEGKPALAQNFTFSFQDATGWIKAPSPSITDFGNGTYAVLLNAQTDQPTNPFLVSALSGSTRHRYMRKCNLYDRLTVLIKIRQHPQNTEMFFLNYAMFK